MFNKEKEEMDDYRKMYDEKPIPDEKLDQAIREGMERAQDAKTKKPRKVKKALWVALAAAVVLFGFSQGFGKIMDLVQNDKGLTKAIESDYYQEIDTSEKKNGTNLTIDGAIADEKGIVLFYTIHSDNGKGENLALDEFELESAEGEMLTLENASFGEKDFDDQPEDSISGVAKFFYQESFDTRSFDAHLKAEGETFDIGFELDEDIGEKKTYDLDEEVTVEGQKINVTKVDVYPIRTVVHLETDSDNTKRLLKFEDLELKDERGETWGSPMGLTGTEVEGEKEKIFYLQSNYFHDPDELYLTFNDIQAVDKSEDELVIDTDKEEIIEQPSSSKIKNLELENDGLQVDIEIDKEFPHQPFNTGTDANGGRIEMPSTSTGDNSNETGDDSANIMEFEAHPEKQLSSYESPLTFPLDFYPEWIEGDVKLKVK